MRRLFLWMSRNRWLRERLPHMPFARRAVLRFMPGEDAESALGAAVALRGQGLASVITCLGENVARVEEADEHVAEYVALLDAIAARGLDGEISVKLTQLGLDLDAERAYASVARLVERAASQGKTVWIDIEGSAYTERTVALYERARTAYRNVGVCLQAYLRRTAADLERLLPLDPAIRLVKGAYAEPPSVAFASRREVDANFVALALAMLDAVRAGRSPRIALATHDVRLIEQVDGRARALGLARSSFEVQMLYGIRVDEQRRLAREGYVVRDLISYGPAWYPWYMRRLAERPANVLFALRQLFP